MASSSVPSSHSITSTLSIATMGPPASPMTCLPSTGPPSALTSASQGKRKASTLGSDVDAPSGKRSCLPSATTKVQQEGSAAISSLASIMQEMSKHLSTPLPVPTTLPAAPPSDFAHTVEVLTSATNISKQDKLEMMLLFLKNKDEAVAFLYMNDELRVAWVEKRLGELCTMMNTD
ncbi:hypothetical protein BDR05DRAFT_1000724 [Suillus weaverae]|nr:hypothetical protein BDR05DRAFT_1000724 [Suillus weaverae]